MNNAEVHIFKGISFLKATGASTVVGLHARARFILGCLVILVCVALPGSNQANHLAQVSPGKSKPARSQRGPGVRQEKSKKKKAGKDVIAHKSKKQESAAGEADDPDGRLNWFWFQRTYPFSEIPSDARRIAWQSIPPRNKGGVELLGPNALSNTWSAIGPLPTTSAFPNNGGPTSGRINAIAVSPLNPQIVLVGSATGGIWRSADGGTTFVPVTDGHVDLAVGAVVFASSNPAIVYAGMGDNDNGYFGSGVLRSNDAGLSWTRVSNSTLPDKGQTMKIVVDPTNPNKVYLAQYSSVNVSSGTSFIGGVYLSTDGGISWTQTLSCLARDLVIHPTNPQILYAGVQFRSGGLPGLYKSVNGGQNWTNVFPSPYTSTQTATRDFRVAVTPASPDRVFIYFGTRTTTPFQVHLEMSDDAGATWTNRGVISNFSIDPGAFGYNTYLIASPTDANTLYVGTRDLFRSTDGGLSFTDLSKSFAPPWPNGGYTPNQQAFHADQQSFAFDSESGATFYAGNDGGIWKTTNNGTSYTSLNSSLSLTQFISIGLHPTDAIRSYGGTQDNGTQLRLNGSNGWREFSSGDGGMLVINPLEPSMIFTSYVRGTMSRFISNGLSFSGQLSDIETFGETDTLRIGFYPPIAGNGVDAKIYLGTWRLFICSDCDDPTRRHGSAKLPTWTAPGDTTDLTNGGSDVLSAIAVAKSNNNIIYTGSRGGRAMASVNAGANWSDITNGLPTRSITSITVSSTDPSLVYLTVSGYGTGHIFRSINGGSSWANISSNLPNIPTSAFLIDPRTTTTLYAGTDIGVFRSTDNGGTWAAFNDGLPPVPVLAFSAQPTGLVQIATYGRGAYEITTNALTQMQFSASSYAVSEAAGTAQILVTRTDTAGAATVDYATSDNAALNECNVVNGSGSSRCDYATSIGTLRFAAGEASQTIFIPVVDDAYAEGNETFTITLSNPTGTTLGATTTANITIQDNETANGSNPIDGVDFFIRQNYIDFLGREPDPAGLAGWRNVLNNCGTTVAPPCDRIEVSAGFFRSEEFQSRGYFIYRFYSSVGRIPLSNDFYPDFAKVSGFLTADQLEANKVAYVNEFMARAEFQTKYSSTFSNPTAYVDALLLTVGLQNHPSRAGWIAGLTNSSLTRAQVLRQLVESSEVYNKYYNEAFVIMQYFGYLRRTADASYLSWIQTMNQTNGDYRTMINGFMNSSEYRRRFGP
ncbi:MAG: DUF4214 domain-containing protein [Acidobacteriota bacterium]